MSGALRNKRSCATDTGKQITKKERSITYLDYRMDTLIKRLNSKEKEYFEERLYPLQDRIMELLDKERFYLTGGTCLSRFYYEHRYSEDLDFFYDGAKYSPGQFELDYVSFIQKIKNYYEIEVTVVSDQFKRLFVKSEDIILKTEFIFEPYPRIGKVKKVKNYFIDTKENIAVNKLTAVYTRKTVKDFFDLYYLLKEFNLADLIEKTKVKFVSPAYEELIISLKESFFEGEVRTCLQVNEKDFYYFVESLINMLIENAKRV